MFKKLRKAASNFFKKITSFFKPKVKIPKGPVGIPTPDKPIRPSTLPGNGSNWVNPVPGMELEDVRTAVDTNNWGLSMGKEALCNAIDNWYYTFGDKSSVMGLFPTFNDSSYEWFSTAMKVTMEDIDDLKNMIMETEAIDYLDWYQHGGGELLVTEMNKSYGHSNPVECYGYVESISEMMLSILNR